MCEVFSSFISTFERYNINIRCFDCSTSPTNLPNRANPGHRPPQFAQSARLSWRHICRNMRRKTVQMMQFLNKMDIPILEYLFGTGKFIQILIDSINHDFDEQTLEAQLLLLIILEAQEQLVEACKDIPITLNQAKPNVYQPQLHYIAPDLSILINKVISSVVWCGIS